MALDQKFFKKSTAATGTADQAQGLISHLDANDVDSYDGDGSIWYDINGHEVNVPLTDNNDNLEVHIDASNTSSYPGYGSTITDISTNGYSFSPHGDATFGSDLRGYFTLDGSDDGLRTTNAVTGFSGDLTFEWWFNASESNNFALLHANPESNDSGINGIFIGNAAGSAGTIEVYRRTTGGTLHSGQTSSTGLSGMASDGWVHFVITITSANVCKFYKDGTYQGTLTLNGNGTNHDTYNFVSIGGYNNASYEFAGKMGCFRMYSEILTAADIGQNYRAGNFLNYSSIITSKHAATQDSLVTAPPTQGTLHTTNLNLNLDANGYSGSGDWQDSANNNDGVIDGATYTNDGNSDYFDFDGSNDVITVAGSDLNPANTKCFEVWFNTDSTGEQYIISNNNGSGAYGYHLGLFSGGKCFMWIYSQEQAHYYVNSSSGSSNTSAITVGEWNHVVWTMGPNASDNKIYLNGNLAYTESSVGGGTFPSSAAHNGIRIGKYTSGGWFNGKIAQVRAYSTALTEAQINTNYNATKDLYQGITSLQLSLDANGYTSGAWSNTANSSYNATVSGATYTNDGSSDYFDFDGSNDYAEVSAYAGTDIGSGGFTIEAWALCEASSGQDTIVSNLGSNLAGYQLYIDGGTDVKLYIYSGGANYWILGSASSAVTVNTWNHYVVTVASTSASAPVKVYVNGVEKISTNLYANSAYAGANHGLDIGRYAYNDTKYFDGKIAQVRTYNGAMTLAQVNTNYNATKALYQNPTALIDYRPDQYSGSGTSITNLGSLSNDAVLTGGIESAYDQELGDFFTIDGTSNSGDGIETTSNVTGVNLSSDGFSWEIWVNIASDNYSYITSFNYSTTDWNLSYRSNIDKIQFFGGSPYSIETTTLELNRWYHIVASADSNGKNLYLDGVLVASNTAAAPNATLDSKIYFGTYHGHSSADHIHDGPIGDGRFYKGVLTAEQVVQNYLATKNKYPNGHSATLVGSPTWGTYNSGGVTYNYFDLNGSSQYMTIPHNTIFDFELPTTLEVWVSKDGTAREWVIEKANGGSTNYSWQLEHSTSAGNFRFQMHNTSNATIECDVSTTTNTGTWYHVAVTHDGNNVFKIYLNGSLQESGTLSGTISKNTNGVTIGKYSLAGGYEFDGKIGMVKFHNKTFSATEVNDAFDNTKGTYGVT